MKNASSIARSLGAAAGSQVHADVMARKKASLLAHVLTSTRLRTSSGWRSFRTRCGRHDVRHHGSGTKRFNHPVVGELTLAYEGLEMAAEPGLTLTIYTAEPGSSSAERLQVLGWWAATPGNDPVASIRTATAELTSEDV